MSDSLTVREAADVLEVTIDADTETISDAYRTQAKEHHPDVSEDSNAVSHFRRIKRARDVLLAANRPLIESSTGANAASSTDEQRWERTDPRSDHTERTAGSAESTTGEGASWSGEQWQKERMRNERAGRSRYRQDRTVGSDPESHGRRAHNEKRTSGRYGDGTRRRRARSRAWGTSPSTTALFRRVGQLVFILGVVATLIPLGLGGSVLPIPLDSTAGFVLSIGGITTGVAGHQWFSAASKAVSQERQEEGRRISLLPIVVANIIGVVLAGFAHHRGFTLGGFRFLFDTLTVAFVPGTVGFLLGGYIATVLASGRVITRQGPLVDVRSAIGGVVGLSIGLAVSLVRIGARGRVFHLGLQPTSLVGEPWLPRLTIGPVGFTSLLNFLVGGCMLALLLGSMALVVWQFPRLRWRIAGSQARSLFHNYLADLSWKLLLLLPVTLLIWMGLAGQHTLVTPVGTLSRVTLGAIVLLLPSLLVGLVLLRGQPSSTR